jgi:hypothetical protein
MNKDNAGPDAAATAAKAVTNIDVQEDTPKPGKNQGPPGEPENPGALNLREIMVSVVNNVKDTDPQNYTLWQVLGSIKGDQFRKCVDEIRRIFQETLAVQNRKAAKAAIRRLKACLPAVLFSGTFSVRNASGLIQHSGVLCCDLDDLGEQLHKLREQIENDEHVLAVFVSPSGDGLKILIPILADAAQHKNSFIAAQEHFRKVYNVELDESGSDVSRLCFLSTDDDIYVNDEAVVLPAVITVKPESKPEKMPVNRKPSGPKPSGPKKRNYDDDGLIAHAPFFGELLEQALETIPADDYQQWIEVGMALHRWDEEAGLDFWDAWSQSSTQYDGTCEEKWSTFDDDHKPVVTWGTILRRARENGWDRDNAFVTALAGLEGLDRERWIKRCASWLDVPQKALRAQIAEHASATGIRGLRPLEPVEPWPEAVDGAELLDDILAVLLRFVVLQPWAYEAAALWVLHSHCFDLCQYTPRLHVWSPTKRCGKSVLLHVLNKLCNKPILASNMSAAAMFRIIDREHPTLLLDEYDSMAYGPKGEDLRNVLNSGFERTGVTYRVMGENFEPVGYTTFCPVILAGIGSIPDTISDRAVSIEMRRKLRGERVERSRKFDGLEIRRKCARWVEDNAEQIREADPAIPDELNDRQADVWEILFVLADLAGGEWPERARAAAIAMAGKAEPDTLPQALLADIRTIFDFGDEDRTKSDDLLKALNAMTDRAWPTICKGREMTAHKLSRMLKDFGIRPGSIRLERVTAKGYLLSQVEEAWERYLPARDKAPAIVQTSLALVEEVEDVA